MSRFLLKPKAAKTSPELVPEQIDRLGRKQFVYPNYDKQTHGYYIQYRFEAEPSAIHEVETHLKLSDQVMLQHYRRL